jgi:hypothetical protein
MPTRAMILVLTSLASLTAYAEAQETLLGLSGGLGLGSATIGGTVSAWVPSPAGEFILRTAATSDFEVLTTPESTTDYALLYGRRRSSERSWLRAALGIGKVHRIERGPVSDC